MTRQQTIIPAEDYQQLQVLVNSKVARVVGGPERLDELQTELARAQIIPQDDVPSDVVTMNSTVLLRDLGTNEVETYTLVFPECADIANHRLSVLAPMGTTILGKRTGYEFRWRVPDGWRKVKIEQVFSLERDDALRSQARRENSQKRWQSREGDGPAPRKLRPTKRAARNDGSQHGGE